MERLQAGRSGRLTQADISHKPKTWLGGRGFQTQEHGAGWVLAKGDKAGWRRLHQQQHTKKMENCAPDLEAALPTGSPTRSSAAAKVAVESLSTADSSASKFLKKASMMVVLAPSAFPAAAPFGVVQCWSPRRKVASLSASMQ
ncbi:hypothetical protein L7F22_049069 [Adiantum nelumboides]|nr:hypothetical protein [Adiantum nelumboides]